MVYLFSDTPPVAAFLLQRLSWVVVSELKTLIVGLFQSFLSPGVGSNEKQKAIFEFAAATNIWAAL